MVLETPGLIEMIDTNLSDAIARADWPLISAVFYMMYVLCETRTGGDTPPLFLFSDVMPNVIYVLGQISTFDNDAERTLDIDATHLGVLAFLEALCLSDGRLLDLMTPLMVERRRGILQLAADQDIQRALFQAATCRKRSISKKAVATLSHMCVAGVDAIHPLVVAGMIPILVAPLQSVSTEAYTKRHIFRIFFLLAKYNGAYMQPLLDHGVIDYLYQSINGFMGSLDTQQLNYAVWALCKATICDGDPLFIKVYLENMCNNNNAVRGFTEALHRCVSGGNLETCNDILAALRRLFEFVPKQSTVQFEEADGLAALSKIIHQAHVDSELYRQASYIHDTYFGDY